MHGKLQICNFLEKCLTQAVILFKKIAEQALIFMSKRETTQNKGKLDVWFFVHFIPPKGCSVYM